MYMFLSVLSMLLSCGQHKQEMNKDGKRDVSAIIQDNGEMNLDIPNNEETNHLVISDAQKDPKLGLEGNSDVDVLNLLTPRVGLNEDDKAGEPKHEDPEEKDMLNKEALETAKDNIDPQVQKLGLEGNSDVVSVLAKIKDYNKIQLGQHLCGVIQKFAKGEFHDCQEVKTTFDAMTELKFDFNKFKFSLSMPRKTSNQNFLYISASLDGKYKTMLFCFIELYVSLIPTFVNSITTHESKTLLKAVFNELKDLIKHILTRYDWDLNIEILNEYQHKRCHLIAYILENIFFNHKGAIKNTFFINHQLELSVNSLIDLVLQNLKQGAVEKKMVWLEELHPGNRIYGSFYEYEKEYILPKISEEISKGMVVFLNNINMKIKSKNHLLKYEELKN